MLGAGLGNLAMARGGAAQRADYPNRPVVLVVPYPPGGATNMLGRMVAQGLAGRLGGTFVTENRPGAATILGARSVIRSSRHDAAGLGGCPGRRRSGAAALPAQYLSLGGRGRSKSCLQLHSRNNGYARASGAPDMYANTMFLQGMWERAVRDYIGLAGTIRRLSGFRMKILNTVGETVVVRGRALRCWRDGGEGLVECAIWSENSRGVSVGPGRVTATLPVRETVG